jgi:hypothetical protein
MNKSNKVFFLFLCFITGFVFAAPEVESVAISGDKLIVTGHKFLNIDGLILSDPKTGFKKPFKVESATESEIIGTAVDNQKITVASLMNLIIDTAKGETTYPVGFFLEKNTETDPTIFNGSIIPEKSKGVSDQKIMVDVVSQIVLGSGMTGSPNTVSGIVPISVDIGERGNPSKTKIPYFNSKNKIVIDSTNSPSGALSGLSFKDGTRNFEIFNDNGLRIDSGLNKDLFVLDGAGNLNLKGPVTIEGFDVCLSNGNCNLLFGKFLITATPPLVATKVAPGGTNISAGAVNTANNLVKLDGTGKFPSTIPGVVRGPGAVTPGTVAVYSDSTGENLGNGSISLTNLVTMSATPTTANKIIISTGANKELGSTSYTIPNTSGVTGQILALTATGTANWVSGVFSFNTRTGAVIPQAGDYTAAQVTNAPLGVITTNTVQNAIYQLANLDSKKLPKAGGIMTGPIITSTKNALKIGPFATGTGEIHFMESTDKETDYVGFKAPANIASKTVWTLPAADGTLGQALVTNGSKKLSWVSGGTAGIGDVVGPSSSTSTNLATFDGTTGKLIQDSGIPSGDLVTMDGAGSVTSGNVIVTAGGKIASDSNVPISNIPTMASNATAGFQPILSGGSNKAQIAAPYTLPSTGCVSGEILKWNGTGFTCQSAFNFPPGMVIDFAGQTCPTGFLACNGTEYSQSLYPNLYSAIGDTWNTFNGQGAPAAGNFRTPNLNSLYVRGSGSSAVGDFVGQLTKLPTTAFNTNSVGAHTHTTDSVGAHTHNLSGSTNTTGAHTHVEGRSWDSGATMRYGTRDTGINSSHRWNGTGSTSATGHLVSTDGDHAHSINLNTNSVGNHTHTTVSAGAHTHTIAGGDSETRPNSAVMLKCIAF